MRPLRGDMARNWNRTWWRMHCGTSRDISLSEREPRNYSFSVLLTDWVDSHHSYKFNFRVPTFRYIFIRYSSGTMTDYIFRGLVDLISSLWLMDCSTLLLKTYTVRWGKCTALVSISERIQIHPMSLYIKDLDHIMCVVNCYETKGNKCHCAFSNEFDRYQRSFSCQMSRQVYEW